MKRFLIVMLAFSCGFVFAKGKIPAAEELAELSHAEIEKEEFLQAVFGYYLFTDEIPMEGIDKEEAIFQARDFLANYLKSHNQPIYRAFLGIVEACCLEYRMFPSVIFAAQRAVNLLNEAAEAEPDNWQIRYYRLLAFVNYPAEDYDFEKTILADYDFLQNSKMSYFELKYVDFMMAEYYLDNLKNPKEAGKYLDKISKEDAEALGLPLQSN